MVESLLQTKWERMNVNAREKWMRDSGISSVTAYDFRDAVWDELPQIIKHKLAE